MPKQKMPHREITYQPNDKLFRQQEAHRGKWVVIVRDDVVLSGDDPFKLQREADERGIEYDLLIKIPDWKEPPIQIL
jgi:hypothetical protein